MKNATLWKRILNQGITPTWPLTKESADMLATKVITSPIILVTMEPDHSPERPIDLKLYRACAMPFEWTWIEQPCEGYVTGWLMHGKRSEGGFDLSAYEFNTIPHRSQIGYLGRFELKLNRAGDYVPGSATCAASQLMEAAVGPERCEVNMRGSMAGLLDVLTMLGCRNIHLEPRENDLKSTRRAAKRFGGNADSYRYHVLTVRPAGSKPGTKGEEIGIMPRHVCRGHLQHYGPAAAHGHPDGRDRGLLFGQHAGRFYIPPHMKGDKKNGEVAKDYAIPAA